MIRLSDADLHPHLIARMRQRGVTRDEIEKTLHEGWDAADAKPGTRGAEPTQKAAKTITIVPGVHADFSTEGKLIGIEVIDAAEIVGRKIEFTLPEIHQPATQA